MDFDILIEAANTLSILNENSYALPKNEKEFSKVIKAKERGTNADIKDKIYMRAKNEGRMKHGPSVKVGDPEHRDGSISIAIKTGEVPDKEAKDTPKVRRLRNAISVGQQFVRCEQALLIALWNAEEYELREALLEIAEEKLKTNKYYEMNFTSVKTGEEFQKDAEEITKLVKKKIGRDPKFKFTLDMKA